MKFGARKGILLLGPLRFLWNLDIIHIRVQPTKDIEENYKTKYMNYYKSVLFSSIDPPPLLLLYKRDEWKLEKTDPIVAIYLMHGVQCWDSISRMEKVA